MTERRIVYGVVYPVNRPDTDNEFMLAEDVEMAAHSFMENIYKQQGGGIDYMHNWELADAHPVESYICPVDIPEMKFIKGDWILGVKINDDDLWDKVKVGDIGGYSLAALTDSVEVDTVLDNPQYFIGITQPDHEDSHVHLFHLNINKMGRIVSGCTSMTNHHSHKITSGTVTNEEKKHKHRIIVR